MIRSVNQTRTWQLTGSPATAAASALNELDLVRFRRLGLDDTSLGSPLDKLPSELWLELSPCSNKAAAALSAACRCKWQGHVKDRALGTSNYQNKKQVKYVKRHTCFFFANRFCNFFKRADSRFGERAGDGGVAGCFRRGTFFDDGFEAGCFAC